MHDGGRIATAKHAQQQRNSNFCSTGIPRNRISGNNWSIFVFEAECPSCRPASSIKALDGRQPGTSPGGPHHFSIYQPTPDEMNATSFTPVLNTCVTRSIGGSAYLRQGTSYQCCHLANRYQQQIYVH